MIGGMGRRADRLGCSRAAMRVLLLALCAALLHPSHAMRGDRDLPGWQGETYRGTPSLRGGNVRGRDTKRWIEHLSWSPRSYLYHNFLTKEETLHLIHLVRAERADERPRLPRLPAPAIDRCVAVRAFVNVGPPAGRSDHGEVDRGGQCLGQVYGQPDSHQLGHLLAPWTGQGRAGHRAADCGVLYDTRGERGGVPGPALRAGTEV
mmetsp:Transcript_62605/g.198219  ORF Transcript_62605/g.198219 Transcript_62605/m.198219 type:complete len:206 (-) Transcript_62605:386-1003(-)